VEPTIQGEVRICMERIPRVIIVILCLLSLGCGSSRLKPIEFFDFNEKITCDSDLNNIWWRGVYRADSGSSRVDCDTR